MLNRAPNQEPKAKKKRGKKEQPLAAEERKKKRREEGCCRAVSAEWLAGAEAGGGAWTTGWPKEEVTQAGREVHGWEKEFGQRERSKKKKEKIN